MTPSNITNNLPIEIFFHLFKFLDKPDLFTCSLVNKHWHLAFAYFEPIHKLVVIDKLNFYFINWYDSHQKVEKKVWRKALCGPETFCLLVNSPKLSKLKYLALNCHKFEFDLNELSKLSQLVQLEITIPFETSFRQKKVNLKFRELKVLVLHLYTGGYSLSIDCPALNTLVYLEKYRFGSQLSVKHPQMIRKLETSMLGWKLSPFKNVECLVADQFEAISKATLLLLPSLKELRYDQPIERVSRHLKGDFIPILYNFLYYAKSLKGSDFKFSFVGFQVNKLKELDRICFESLSNESFYAENYQLIKPNALHFVRRVHYNELMYELVMEPQSSFFQKFTQIEQVFASGTIQNSKHFLEFLESISSLRRLRLGRTKLTQQSYDRLPLAVPLLFELELYEKQLVNFDFIGKFTGLQCLSIGHCLSLESLRSLVGQLGNLSEIFFRFETKELRIKKIRGSKVFRVYDDQDQTAFVTENVEQMVNFLEELQNVAPPTFMSNSPVCAIPKDFQISWPTLQTFFPFYFNESYYGN